jgi:hypothetical protein
MPEMREEEHVKFSCKVPFIYLNSKWNVSAVSSKNSPMDFFKPHFIYNLYIYIQQIGVRIGCYGLGKGTH